MVRKLELSAWLAAVLCASVAFLGSRGAAGLDLGDLQIPEERVPVWSPGVEGGVPDSSAWPVINAQNYGATPNDGISDTAAINAAIAAAAALDGNTVVYLPPGTYRFQVDHSIVMMSNVVLRGAGPEETVITGEKGLVGHPIRFVGSAGADVSITNSSLPRGTSDLTLSTVAGLGVGDYLYMYQNNDPSYITEPAPCRCRIYMTHIARISSISGNTVTLDRPLRHPFLPSFNPRVKKMNPIENAGIEDLKVMFDLGATVNGFDLAYFSHAVNCWAKNVFFFNGYWHHVSVEFSARNTLLGSKFEILGYNTGYSVALLEAAVDNLVTNNVVFNVNTAVDFARGASGNVYSYNYHPETTSPSAYRENKIYFHGQYPHENLVEGNDTARNDDWGGFKYDNYWGIQGPRNTIYRNRFRNRTPFYTHDDRGKAIGTSLNVLLNTAFSFHRKPFCDYEGKGNCGDLDERLTGLWAERNVARDVRADDQPLAGSRYGWVLGTPEPSTVTIENVDAGAAPASWATFAAPPSLYLTSPPDFWGADMPWPGIGADVDDLTTGSFTKLPAQLRYEGVGVPPVAGDPPVAPVLLD